MFPQAMNCTEFGRMNNSNDNNNNSIIIVLLLCNMALKVLFYEILCDQDLLEKVPPWYSPVMPKSVCKLEQIETW